MENSSMYMTPWDGLSMADKAEMMRVAVRNGITSLPEIRKKYNEFANGGPTDDDLIDWIIREEGFLTTPQNIGDGKITLGSGLTAQKWHDLYRKNGNKWSKDDNRRAVAEEVALRRKWAEKSIPHWNALPESSQKALLSYKYNYDFTRANSPKLFAALETGNLFEAARQMDATSKDPKFKKGLMERRKREQQWFLQDLAPKIKSEEPPVSTAVVNPFAPQIENTRSVSYIVPDADNYVSVHEAPQEDIATQKAIDALEAQRKFNNIMRMFNLATTRQPSFFEGNPYLNTLTSLYGNTEAYGGPIVKDAMAHYYDGTSETTQQMDKWGDTGWNPLTLEEISKQAEVAERRRKALLDKKLAETRKEIKKRNRDYLTISNDATSTQYTTNEHLKDRASKGAKSHRAWEAEHPNWSAWGNVAGAIPFAATAAPFVEAAIPTASATLATAGKVLQTYSPALYTIGKTALHLTDNAAATYLGYLGAKDVSKGKFTPNTALNLLPFFGKAVEQGSRVLPYNRLEKNYTGVPHNQSRDINGQSIFSSNGNPIYMDTSFPAVHNEKTVWTANDVDYAKIFATPDKANQPIGTIFDIYTDPKKLSVLETPVPKEGVSYYWQGLPFQHREGKIVIAPDAQLISSGVAKNREISLLRGGQGGSYNPNELSATLMRKRDIGTLNWDKNPMALKTDDLVEFSNKHGYDATRFHQIQDGPSLINGDWHYYPINELVLNPGAEKYILPHGASKLWLWNQIPKKRISISNSFLPALNNLLNQE